MIQLASMNDIDDIYYLICILEQEIFDKDVFIEVYKQNSKDPTVHYYVYKIENKSVGFISLYEKHLLHHNGKTGEIVELVVDDNYRNQHIGARLLTFVENKAKELGLLELELSSGMKRTRAHSFYEKQGYVKDHYNLIKKL